MNTLTKKYTVGITLSIIVFVLSWYDTAHAHIFTGAINNWVLQVFYISSNATGEWQQLYYDTLNDMTALGGEPIFQLALIFLFLYLVVERHTQAVIYCFFASVIIIAVTLGFKLFFDAPRPMFPEHTSFPSGHVARACIWCGIILFLNQIKIFHLSRYWCGVFIVIPILVGFSRIGLGYHWLSDVVASCALSIAVFLSALIVQSRIKA
jgi:membrane-associated phospholipid phosphatase